MSQRETEHATAYKVVLKHEEQYSIRPADRDEPTGWKAAGKRGTKAECLAYIKEVWTDMRPGSIREPATDRGTDADQPRRRSRRVARRPSAARD